LGNAAIDFAVKVFDDFRAVLLRPLLRGGDRLTVFEDERVGEFGKRVGLGLVVVGGVSGIGVVAVRPLAQLFDAEQFHHQLVILLRGQSHGGRQRGGDGLRRLGWIGGLKLSGDRQDKKCEAQ